MIIFFRTLTPEMVKGGIGRVKEWIRGDAIARGNEPDMSNIFPTWFIDDRTKYTSDDALVRLEAMLKKQVGWLQVQGLSAALRFLKRDKSNWYKLSSEEKLGTFRLEDKMLAAWVTKEGMVTESGEIRYTRA